jgi:hypothetical protein
MATALRLVDGRHGAQAAGPILPAHAMRSPGVLARLTASARAALRRFHARYRADAEKLPIEYWSWPCY